MQEKPLVSVCFTCYNRKRYVAEAFQSILDQTYSPLEIVVCDNCSTDGTWEIVSNLANSYQKAGGIHNIVLNRNKENVGLVRNIEKCYSLAHGELIVAAHDDDVSMSERVEKIVEKWDESNRTATIIACNGCKISQDGDKIVGDFSDYNQWTPLGAANAYSRKVIEFFKSEIPIDAFEDWVFHYRALMLGEYAWVDEPVIKYRIGTGDSTSIKSYRKSQYRRACATIKSANQILEEMDICAKYITVQKKYEMNSRIVALKKDRNDKAQLWGGESVMIRSSAFRKIHAPFNTLSIGMYLYVLVQILALFPNSVNDWLIDKIMQLKLWGKNMKFNKINVVTV